MFLWDVLLSILVAFGLTELLLRVFHVRGPWRRRGWIGLVVFLAAWSGGVWLAPGAMREVGWIYGLPFVLAGLAAAFVIAIVSPSHRLTTAADRKAFEREEQAVSTGVIVFFWSLCALLLAVIVRGYWNP